MVDGSHFRKFLFSYVCTVPAPDLPAKAEHLDFLTRVHVLYILQFTNPLLAPAQAAGVRRHGVIGN